MTTPTTADSFWKRPEGTTGKLLILAMLAGAGVGLYKLLPYLITIAENTLYLGALGVALFAFYALVTSPRVHSLIFYAFAMVSRAITSNFVDIDPVAILESFTAQMKKRRKQVEESIVSIMGVIRTLQNEIAQANKEMVQALKLADAASMINNEDDLSAQTEIAGRRENTIAQYTQTLHDVNEVLDALRKVKSRADYHITTSEDEVRDLTRKNEIAKETRKATKAANAIFGDTDLFAVRNMAADRIRERYDGALGELDGYIEMAKNIDSEIDLNRAVFQSEGKKRLAELRAKLAKAEPAQLTSGPAASIIPVSAPAMSLVDRKFKK